MPFGKGWGKGNYKGTGYKGKGKGKGWVAPSALLLCFLYRIASGTPYTSQRQHAHTKVGVVWGR